MLAIDLNRFYSLHYSSILLPFKIFSISKIKYVKNNGKPPGYVKSLDASKSVTHGIPKYSSVVKMTFTWT